MIPTILLFKKKANALFNALCIAAGLILHASAFAQSGCTKVFFNPQEHYLHNTASAASAPFPLKQGRALGEVTYSAFSRGEN